ncbi:MAG: phosphotransferase, partial [Cyanobium sp.]
MSATALTEADLRAVAEAFDLPGPVASIAPLGSGNVNDTFVVEAGDQRYVLQRLNTQVFRRPELVMRNLQVLDRHVQRRLRAVQGPGSPLPAGRRWELPQVVCTRDAARAWHCCQSGGFWRILTFVNDTRSVDVIEHRQQARELGWGLGLFHHLISDLPVEQLADTLEGFHITPRYREAYLREWGRTSQPRSPLAEECVAFIREREAFAGVLEQAKARGELPLRP